MLVIGLQTSPNEDGLTAKAAKAALEGAKGAGAETELIHLRKQDIQACRACEKGWGRCAREGLCIIEDDMQALRERLYQADAIVLSTPVYFGEVSEVTKCFLDRVRRCERRMEGPSPLEGKPILCIAAAGGSGGGTLSCLQILDRYCSHLHLRVFDNVPLMRRSREYMLAALPAAGKALVRGDW